MPLERAPLTTEYKAEWPSEMVSKFAEGNSFAPARK
jgi:hypothetical protein